MSDDFEYCLAFVLGVEGGYINHPNDRGGETNLGIRASLLQKLGQTLDIHKLSPEQAAHIYKSQYWDVLKLDEIDSQNIKLLLFDQAVNRGPKTTVQLLQGALNSLQGRLILVDGVMGPKTIAEINSVNPQVLARKFLQVCQKRYAEIVVKDPTQAVFLLGWLSRTFALWDRVG